MNKNIRDRFRKSKPKFLSKRTWDAFAHYHAKYVYNYYYYVILSLVHKKKKKNATGKSRYNNVRYINNTRRRCFYGQSWYNNGCITQFYSLADQLFFFFCTLSPYKLENTGKGKWVTGSIRFRWAKVAAGKWKIPVPLGIHTSYITRTYY